MEYNTLEILINKIWVLECEKGKYYYFPMKCDKDEWLKIHNKKTIEELNVILTDLEYFIERQKNDYKKN